MDNLQNQDQLQQEEIRVEPYGKEGYRILVGGGYPFEAIASNKQMSFIVENEDQRDSLLQIISNILDAVKTAMIQKKVSDQLNDRIRKQVLSVLDEMLENEVEKILERKAKEGNKEI